MEMIDIKILLADGVEGWFEILVLIIFVAIGSIVQLVKARSEKAAKEKKRQEQPPKRPSSNAQKARLRFEKLFQQEEEPQEPAQQQVVGQPGQVRPRMSPPPIRPPKPPARKEPVKIVQPYVKAVEQKKDSEVPMSEIIPREHSLVEELLEPGQLESAILHYEILGKCIALRGYDL